MAARLTLSVAADPALSLGADQETPLAFSLEPQPRLPSYSGPTEFTPTDAEQTVPVMGRSMLTDITINPIPSNYGLVAWNGTVLTVS